MPCRLWLCQGNHAAGLAPTCMSKPLAVALVPSLLFRMYSTLNQSLGYPRLVTWLQAGAVFVKIPLSVLLTFGAGDVPGLGVVGLPPEDPS